MFGVAEFSGVVASIGRCRPEPDGDGAAAG